MGWWVGKWTVGRHVGRLVGIRQVGKWILGGWVGGCVSGWVMVTKLVLVIFDCHLTQWSNGDLTIFGRHLMAMH